MDENYLEYIWWRILILFSKCFYICFFKRSSCFLQKSCPYIYNTVRGWHTPVLFMSVRVGGGIYRSNYDILSTFKEVCTHQFGYATWEFLWVARHLKWCSQINVLSLLSINPVDHSVVSAVSLLKPSWNPDCTGSARGKSPLGFSPFSPDFDVDNCWLFWRFYNISMTIFIVCFDDTELLTSAL